LQEALFFFLLQEGIYMGARGFLAFNLTHEEGHVERALAAFRKFRDEVLS
jgi:glutamate-1-semialdehyde 2,1-aminomutase